MGKTKLVAGIILLLIGLGLIPTGIVIDRRINTNLDAAIPAYLLAIQEDMLPDIEEYTKYYGIPESMEGLKNYAVPQMPEVTNGSISLREITNTLADLAGYIGSEEASEWFFNDPAWTVNTDGNYTIQGISEYTGLGNLSFSPEAQDAFLTNFGDTQTGEGFYTLFSEIGRVPTEIGQFSDGGLAQAVYISGDYAYVADGTDGLEIIDISDPENPTQVGQFDNGGVAYGVVVSGIIAYVADGPDGLEIVNLTDPENPTLIAQYINGTADANDVVVSGDYAYVADGADGLEIVDISNSSNPQRVGHFDDGGVANAVVKSGNYIYLADGTDGLEIINVTISTNPTQIGQFDDGGVANGLVKSGSYIYLADGTDGLEIIDVFDLENPSEIGQFYDGGVANDVVYSGGYAYVADGSDGFEIVGVSDPSEPYLAGQFFDGANAFGIKKVGTHVYIADGADGLEIYDVTYPSAEYLIETHYVSTFEQIVEVSDYILDYLFPLVPALGGLPMEVSAANAEDLFYLQWANATIMPESWEISLTSGSIIDWEFNSLGLSFDDVYNIWNDSLFYSPLSTNGIFNWIWVNETIENLIQDNLSISEPIYDGLYDYFFDENFGNDIIVPLLEFVQVKAIDDIYLDSFVRQWSLGALFPNGIASFNPSKYELLLGWEVTLPKDLENVTYVYDIDVRTLRNMWEPDNRYALVNSSGINDWLGVMRIEPDRGQSREGALIASLEYPIIDAEFDISAREAIIISNWLNNFRYYTMPKIMYTQGLFTMFPTELADLANILGYSCGAILGFVGIILILSYRKR
jgi:hypothetical protein